MQLFIFIAIMILKLYKSNISLGVILIPFFAVLISLPILFNDFSEINYYYGWQNSFFNFVNKFGVLNFILTVSFLIINAVLINKVFSRANLFSKSTYVPALFYTVFVSFLGVLNFSPSLIIHLFLIGLIDQLMKVNKGDSAIHISFKSGLLVGLISCFTFYYIGLVFIIFITLYSIKSLNWREWALVVLGTCIPLLYLFSAQYIFTDNFDLGSLEGSYILVAQLHLINYIQISCVLLIVIVSLKSLLRFYNHNTTLSKKRLFVLLMLFMLILTLFFTGFYLFKQVDYTLIVPLSLLLATSAISNQRDSLVSLLLTIALVVNIVALFIG